MIEEVLKKLKIRKAVLTSGDVYYFVGTERGLFNIEYKLETCADIKNLRREFFSNGFGRICFELK